MVVFIVTLEYLLLLESWFNVMKGFFETTLLAKVSKACLLFLSLFFPSEFLRRKTALKYYQKGLFVLVFLPGPEQAGNASGNTSLLALASDTPLAQPLGEVVSVSRTGAGNANPPTAAGEDAVPKPGMLCFTVLSPRQNSD